MKLLLPIFFFLAVMGDSSRLFSAEPPLRELIVSHSDENNILQLYRVLEDGSARRKLTNSKYGCMQPAVSPDAKKIAYLQQTEQGMELWLCDLDGKNPKRLREPAAQLMPAWCPDSKHLIWMVFQPGKEPAEKSQLHIMNTQTMESRRLFSDPIQTQFSNSMPAVCPLGEKVAFVSNRSGCYRVWLSDFDGSNAKPISPTLTDEDPTLKLPVEQKVPVWSDDGKWIAHWEGIEMIHLSKFTGIKDRKKDRLISETWHVWVVDSNGLQKRKAGRGDDPTWSPDGFVTRSFPDPERGGPKIMIETNDRWRELPLVPPRASYGRFAWIPNVSDGNDEKER